MLQHRLLTTYPWLRTALIVVLAITVGIATGAAVAFGPYWAGFLVIIALGFGSAMLVNTTFSFAIVIGLATILPFATLPFRAVITPSLLSLALLALLGVWFIRLLLNPDQHLELSPLGLPILGFYGVTLFAFLLGSRLSPESTLLHNYVKFSLALFFFFSVLNCIQNRDQARWALRFLILGGAISAFIGVLLYFTPDRLALQGLVALSRIGYPDSGRVLRYIEDDPNGIERAIGLSIDPNSFGGMLALIGALTATQIVAEKPLFARRWLIGMSLIILLALFLTYSRAALGGMIVAAMYVATLRYRRLWWLILAGGGLAALLFIGLGVGEEFVNRVTEGIQFRDQANQMRLAEYSNAIAVIQAYPIFGIGFGSAPDIDLVAGVSSIYLAIGQRTGLVGLAVFFAIMVAFFVRSLSALNQATTTGDTERAAWLVSIQASLASALAVGILDHYFFNIEFSHMVALFWGNLALALVVEQLAPQTE
jgi:O-antigen ligase